MDARKPRFFLPLNTISVFCKPCPIVAMVWCPRLQVYNLMILLEKGVTNCPNWGFMLLGATRCGLKKDKYFVRVSVAHCCSQEEMILHPRWYLVNTYGLHTHIILYTHITHRSILYYTSYYIFNICTYTIYIHTYFFNSCRPGIFEVHPRLFLRFYFPLHLPHRRRYGLPLKVIEILVAHFCAFATEERVLPLAPRFGWFRWGVEPTVWPTFMGKMDDIFIQIHI